MTGVEMSPKPSVYGMPGAPRHLFGGTATPGHRRRRITIFSAVQDQSDLSWFLRQSWRPYITGDISVYPVDCTHSDLLTAESVSIYGDQLETGGQAVAGLNGIARPKYKEVQGQSEESRTEV
jgi:hypothetical protein